MTWDIRVGLGCGPLDIGTSPAAVRERMGEPDHVHVEGEGTDTEELL